MPQLVEALSFPLPTVADDPNRPHPNNTNAYLWYWFGGGHLVFLDDTTVMLSERAVDSMPEYSTSVPTYLGLGKVWLADRGADGWFLRLVQARDGDVASIRTFKVAERRLSDRPAL